MQILVSSPYWVVREYPEHRLVQLKRSGMPFESLFDLEVAVDELTPVFQGNYEFFGIVVDMRSAPLRSDASLQAILRRVRVMIEATFARVSVLVQSHTGMLQMTRITRDEHSGAFVTMSETAAFEFAKGLAVRNRRTRSSVISEAPRIASPDPIEEASHWAKELDDWAIVREKVLSKIDIRAARRARSLASEIRRSADIALDLTEFGHGDIGKVAPLLDELAALRIEAVELMLGTAPPPRKISFATEYATGNDNEDRHRLESGTQLGRTVRALDRASTAEQIAARDTTSREVPSQSLAVPKSVSESSDAVASETPRPAKSTT